MKTITKMLLPSLELTILIINFLSTNLKIALKTLPIEDFKKYLMIFHAKFETKIILKSPKLTKLFSCSNCDYNKAGYILCSSISFKLTNGKTITWTVKMLFIF